MNQNKTSYGNQGKHMANINGEWNMKIFEFRNEETKSLARILKTFDKIKVIFFLKMLSGLITRYRWFKSNRFPKRDIEKNILPDLKQCEVTLERILEGFEPNPLRNFDSMKDERISKVLSFQMICMEAAGRALPHIRAIEKTLEELLAENRKGRGHPQADHDGFVYEVAKLYKLFFDREPSKAKNGIFCNLIDKLFGIIFPKKEDDKVKDHNKSKTVEKALDKLKAG